MNLTIFTALIDCIKNDLHYMHFYCSGPMFDVYHKILDDYYTKLQDQYDEFAELCIQNGLGIVHPNESASIGYKNKVEDEEDFDYKNTPSYIASLLSELVNSAVEVLSQYQEPKDAATRSTLEEFIKYWDKECKYKNTRRMI